MSRWLVAIESTSWRLVLAAISVMTVALWYPTLPAVAAGSGPVHNVTQDVWYATIQEALDAAYPADTIVLTPGTYTGPGNCDLEMAGNDLVLRGADPGDPDVVAQTVILPDGSSGAERRGFWIHGGQTQIAGLTIAGGYAYDGAAIFCDAGASVGLSDCVFRDNAVPHDGGAVTAYEGSTVEVQRCRFENNHSDWTGGGLLLNASDASLSECTFVDNSAERGGAIAAWGGCTVTLDNCALTGGQASLGAGLYLRTSTAELTACDLARNNATWGGCVQANGGSQVTLRACRLSDNTVVYDGGALAIYGSVAIVEGCEFVNCSGYWGGCILTRDSDLTVTAGWFEQNYAGYGGAALHCDGGGWSQFLQCTFLDNVATRGAVVHSGGEAAPTFESCRFLRNVATIEGGAANIYGSSMGRFVNCIVGGNNADFGGAFSMGETTEVSIDNCTMYGNYAVETGDVITVAQQSTVFLDSAISWQNVASDAPLRLRDQAVLSVQFCDIMRGESAVVLDAGATLYWGEGNIDTDPLFANLYGADAVAGTEDDDWHLTLNSPCVAAGNPALTGDTDADGQARVLCGRVDIGADEAVVGDADCDRDVDVEDVAMLSACLSGPEVNVDDSCAGFDFYGDNDIDLIDAAELQRRFGQ